MACYNGWVFGLVDSWV